jgi:anti-sigma regulatory factor (Ser/Thr protein kinase)/putative methionine-R-sulfoxide reductase with GAF domain
MAEHRYEPQHREPRAGQVVLSPVSPDLAPSEQIRVLTTLNDPALSELGLEEFLEELLVRVRDALSVDTVAILLHDPDAHELVARAAKGIEEEVEQGVRIPVGMGFAGRIAAERVAIFIADVDHADIMNPILREKGIRSLLGVPLIVEGDLIGVLHVGSLRTRTFGQRDLAVLQAAAGRAAPGIERARLHSALEEEHRVATLLQRSLLPKRLPEIVGVAAAARYLPASDEVGGDWYDVFELPRGRIGVAIGDVVGHGLRAATLMGQLRTALHAYAVEDNSPAAALELVDRFVQAMPDDAMATAAYAVLDPFNGQVRLASAGHLPPLVIGPEDHRIVDIAPATPLGAFPYGAYHEHAIELAPDEILVFYTDGLIERPEVPLERSIGDFMALIEDARSAEDACRRAVARMVPVAGLRDDAAIVAVQNVTVPSELRMRLRADPRVLAEIRRALRRWLRSHGADERSTSEIVLAVCEACTNAIEHAYSPAPADFELHAREREGVLEFVVSDTGRWRQSTGEHRGRGLMIIGAAMDAVEVNTDDRGTVVVMRRSVRR